MTLAPGVRLGPYEIVAPLGAGGMGEVWRARDTRLGREVAIKVLPAAFAADPALKARIEREAKSISSLNHPNICTLHDIGREGDLDYLVLELVEGETMAQRLARGPLPMVEVLRYGIQIADALERAHRAGIVHRDLKPGNVMITRSGAKLLDFGLARGKGPGGEEAGKRTISPTMAEPLTREGHIVGTFQYMAPEQLEGADADPRSDLWALGCVLYEMATGQAPFKGASQASLISAIMKDEPRSIAELAPLSPPAFERAVQQCLAKDPEERWQTAGDLRRELAWISTSGSQASAIAPASPAAGTLAMRSPALRRLRAWALPLLAGVAIMGLAWLAIGRDRPETPLRLAFVDEGPGRLARDPAQIVISPDGEAVAYVVRESTSFTLRVRRLSEPSSRVLARTTQPMQLPFWAPTSRDLGYFTLGEGGKLWRVSLSGGAPAPLAPAGSARGGTWNAQGVILYAPEPNSPLFRVSAAGGNPVQATVLDTARGQNAHRAPQFLPDGDHFLYGALPGTIKGPRLFVGSLRSGKVERLDLEPQSGAVYADPGFLLYSRDGKLVAHRFDARTRKLSGEPFIVADATDLTLFIGSANVSTSRNGRLAWKPSPVTRSRLEWVDRGGHALSVLETVEGLCGNLAIQRDGRRVLASRTLSSGRLEVIYHDPDRGSVQRVSPSDIDSNFPVWAPDGESFYMLCTQGRDEIYRQSLARAGKPELVPTTDHQFKGPRAVTPDGRTLIFQALNPATDWDIYRLDLGSDRPPEVVFEEPGFNDAALSPDGRLLALLSQATAEPELFVAPLDRPRALKRVSPRTWFFFAWGANGRELFYEWREDEESSVFAIPIDPGSGTATGPAQLLFRRRGLTAWTPAPDGKRFLLSVRDRITTSNEIRIDVNWPALARRK